MARVLFTPHLERFLDCPPGDAEGKTLAQVIAAVCAEHPRLRGYILDDQGALRTHVTIFVDGTMVRDRQSLSDPVGTGSEVYVMQALSGGQE